MALFFAEHEADAHQRELRKLAATRPRPIRTASPARATVGRWLITAGLRLCLPNNFAPRRQLNSLSR